ncbi:hypothetical protein LCGC14_1395210 [marine sediment metagenome]|uniref:Uncharacterized protein n=1 Tax=marine sediment metagenome TaxID=412755 RepID=A0A0F9JYT9_9ZZZZ
MDPALDRFSRVMNAELEAHAEEFAEQPWSAVRPKDLLLKMELHMTRLRSAMLRRLGSRSPEELQKENEAVKKQATHVANYALFVHQQIALGRP